MQQICISQSYSTGTSTGSTTTTLELRQSNTQWNKIRGFSVDILELLNDCGGLIRFCRISRGNISKGVGLLNKGVKPMRKSPSLRISSKYNLSLIHISEPTRLGMISYAVFCLKKKKKK